ncbi:MAG: glycosyltransferase [Bacteroidetes bacterium]|nr:glycosyltransferase [Bacteroidota bacterium]
MSIFYLLTFAVCGAYVLLLIFYLIGWKKTQSLLLKPSTLNHLPMIGTSTIVSIIVPVRNEEQNILKLLSCLVKQTYPSSHFEIIIVNDHSTDRTAEFISAQKVSNIKFTELPAGKEGKKSAIAEGIKHAAGQFIITTDADCEMGERWLESIAAFYEKEKPKMIVAPVLLKEEKNFFEKLQSQEMLALAASACGSLYYHLPVLCSGANLAYEKNAFDAVNGFEGMEKTLTGDDMFLLLKFHKFFSGEIKYLKSNEAVVITLAEKNFSGALRQRKRWASKTFLYGFSHITLTAILVFGANFFIFLSAMLFIINVKFAFALIATLFIKCAIDYMMYHSASSFFGKKVYPLLFIAASLLYPVYVSALGLISPFTNYSWKERKS